MSKIKDFINQNENVQVACCYANCGIISVYLTNSGMVTRKEFGYIEDFCEDEGYIMNNGNEYKTLRLRITDFKRIEKLQNILSKIY